MEHRHLESSGDNFFYGLYGGPRTRSGYQQWCEEVRDYKFLKEVKNENVVPACERFEEVVRDPEPSKPLEADLLMGCANLFDQIDKRIQVTLRDGRIIVGTLFSVDHFSNLTLRDSVERIVVGKEYGDIHRGLFLIRGDNLVLIGEMNEKKEEEMERVLRKVPIQEILSAQKVEQECVKAKQSRYSEALKRRGMYCSRQFEEDF